MRGEGDTHREHERADRLHAGELKVEAPQPLVFHQEPVAEETNYAMSSHVHRAITGCTHDLGN